METIKSIDPANLVYLDESGIDDNEVYPYGWQQKGYRVHAMKYGERTKRISVIGALIQKILCAPFVFEGSCTRPVFEVYLEKVLVPVLKPGNVVVMDNASFHKGGRIDKIIQSAGCSILYLPAYSPDFNPIEHLWFSVKHRIRCYLQNIKRDLYDAAIAVFS